MKPKANPTPEKIRLKSGIWAHFFFPQRTIFRGLGFGSIWLTGYKKPNLTQPFSPRTLLISNPHLIENSPEILRMKT